MMLHIEHCHCQFDRLSILSQLLLYLSITNAHHPVTFVATIHLSSNVIRWAIVWWAPASKHVTCSPPSLSLCICPIWAVPRCNSKRKEIGEASCFFKQTFIFAQSSLGSSWLGSICNHSHIPITCPLAPHLSEQLSRGAATQVDPGEELQVPGSKWGKQLGSAAQPPRTQTPPCCSRLSRGENQ